MTKRTKGERRRDAVEACQALIVGKPYKPGTRDCLKLLLKAVRSMGGSTTVAKGAKYSTEAGALRELKKRGFDDLPSAIDAAGLVRIAPSAALPADILGLRTAESAFGIAVAVYAGNGKAVTFTEGFGVTGKLMETPVMAWRNA